MFLGFSAIYSILRPTCNSRTDNYNCSGCIFVRKYRSVRRLEMGESNKSLHSTIYALSLVCMVAELPF